jgi:hypothetical protein
MADRSLPTPARPSAAARRARGSDATTLGCLTLTVRGSLAGFQRGRIHTRTDERCRWSVACGVKPSSKPARASDQTSKAEHRRQGVGEAIWDSERRDSVSHDRISRRGT